MAISGRAPRAISRLIAAIKLYGNNMGASAKSNMPAARRNVIVNNFSAYIFQSPAKIMGNRLNGTKTAARQCEAAIS
jgi:hypothetical protein